MSVVVSGLTKIYQDQKAIDNLSFEVNKGEIVGFLGPNGAGKTTTMKIITGFIPASKGSASVCGLDIKTDSLEARKKIGYLPEHNPLYEEMYVKEYLGFVCDLYKIKNKKERVAEMIELTGLTLEQHKPISALSKGYRQRVGLAQALINDPEVLILDEPTSGLDPNQLVEIRQLIKKFGKDKTVIFSSHIMQEVQALCDRVIILNRGVIIADDPIDNLQERVKGNAIVTLVFNDNVNPSIFEGMTGVLKISALNNTTLEVTSSSENDLRPALFKRVVETGNVLLEMREEKASFENVFQELTSDA